MSTHNLLFYMDQQHWDMCSLSDKKKFDWPLLFKNQLMLKAQKTVPKGIPATHAVWHSAISIWFQFDFNLISIGKRHRTLVFCPILCPIWIVFPRIVRKYLSLPNLSINGQTKRIAISKIYLSTIHWKVRRVQTPPTGNICQVDILAAETWGKHKVSTSIVRDFRICST